MASELESKFELYAVAISAPGQSVRLNAPGGNVGDTYEGRFQILPDSNRVVYSAVWKNPGISIWLNGPMPSGAYVSTNPDSFVFLPEDPTFQINIGLSDAWYNPASNGQGFLFTVFPEIKQMFLAWFTFDTERPPGEVTAMPGKPGHRWLTAQGPYEGDTAHLSIFVTEGVSSTLRRWLQSPRKKSPVP